MIRRCLHRRGSESRHDLRVIHEEVVEMIITDHHLLEEILLSAGDERRMKACSFSSAVRIKMEILNELQMSQFFIQS